MLDERLIMLAAVAVWFAVSLVSRLWAAALGMGMSLALGAWGWSIMASGKTVGVLGLAQPLSVPWFFAIVGLLGFINAMTFLQSIRERRARRSPGGPEAGPA